VRGALLVFAKEPRPGAVKTRLCPPFSAEQAASFYAFLLADILETSAAAAERLGLAPILCVAPAEACERVAAGAPAAYRVLPQRGRDLGARMERAFEDAAALHGGPLLLRGSDSPLLGEGTLAAALAALEEADLALSPDLDGGYNLVGLRRPAPGLFAHAMSTATVLADTLANAGRLGLRAVQLEAGFDLDTAADLAHLARARREGRAGCCPRSLAFLDREGLWP
jgi:rSAM/selenodomain-associated transferase 1